MILKKFYDAAPSAFERAAAAFDKKFGASNEPAPAATPNPTPDVVPDNTGTDNPPVIPDQADSPAEPAATPDPAPVNEPQPDTPGAQEPTPAAAPAPEPVPQPTPEPTAPPKTKQQILKELGLDDFGVGAFEHYIATGKLDEYLEVKLVDYTKMPAEEIKRLELRKQFPDLDEETFGIIYQAEVTDKYKLDPTMYSEAEVKAGQALLTRDTAPVRKELIDFQQKFKAPERNTAAEEAARQAQEQQQYEAFVQSITTDAATQQFNTDKGITFPGKEKGVQFKFEVENTSDYVETVTNGEKWQELVAKRDASGKIMRDQQGNAISDVQKLLKISVFAKDPEGFTQALINHGRNLEKKAALLNRTNPENTVSVPATGEPKSIAEAAKNARRVGAWGQT